jgi:hypothetical protein
MRLEKITKVSTRYSFKDNEEPIAVVKMALCYASFMFLL